MRWLISTFLYFADPLTTLPAITFWLLGGLGRVTTRDASLALLAIVVPVVVLYTLRWPINVLALGRTRPARWSLPRTGCG